MQRLNLSIVIFFALACVQLGPALAQNSSEDQSSSGSAGMPQQDSGADTAGAVVERNFSSSTSSLSSSSSRSSSSSSSSSSPPSQSSSPSPAQSPNPPAQSSSSVSDNGPVFGAAGTEKPSIKFVPKFKQRLNDIADQSKMAQGKNFITATEASQFLERENKLLSLEADASKNGFPKSSIDDLEKAITLLNGDLFKAIRKSYPVKPGTAEKEVNDPNLIPAYPDPELQPGSGQMEQKK